MGYALAWNTELCGLELIVFRGKSPIVCFVLMSGCVSSQCSGKAFCLHIVCHQGGDLLDRSVGGLRVGSEAAGVRLRREGVFALPLQLCGDGFFGDPAAQASLGSLTPQPKQTAYVYCTCTC